MSTQRLKVSTACLLAACVLLLEVPTVELNLNCECDSSTAQLVDGQCYVLSLSSGPKSAETCRPNGRIALVDSQHKHDTLWGQLLQSYNTHAWIGLVDTVPGGGIADQPRNWTWGNGKELTWSAWRYDQPNGFSAGLLGETVQDCVLIDNTGRWQDKPCGESYSTLCEIKEPVMRGSHWLRLLATKQWLGTDKERLPVSSLEDCSLLCFRTAECYMFAVGTAADSVGLTCQLGCYFDISEDAPADDWLIFYKV